MGSRRHAPNHGDYGTDHGGHCASDIRVAARPTRRRHNRGRASGERPNEVRGPALRECGSRERDETDRRVRPPLTT